MTTDKGNINTVGDINSVGGNIGISAGTGDIELKNVTSAGNIDISSIAQGSIKGNNVTSGGTTSVVLSQGDLSLDLAEGETVVLHMDDNTAASNVNRVSAKAGGGNTADVDLSGNFIQIGSIVAADGTSPLQVSFKGAGAQKLISGGVSVGGIHSQYGTRIPNLWTNQGYLHVDEGDLVIDDMFAVNQIHVDNSYTNFAVFGGIPVRDGANLVYWNNFNMADSKARSFHLYQDGKVRTKRAVLVDAGRNYNKLYGDNLSVMDMMRERVTNEHGKYTFDSRLLTEYGRRMKAPVFFGMESTLDIIRRQHASDAEIVVE
ncbi:MAG: hypothetical protein K6C05_06695 [Anaerovibrio sp.]|uniref:hypothetical protein n=1 Tax=Anaerovibrio sp. TaxID=1872532 RepID=UPI0025D99EF2|nr:hypothetical protein [Anaerovibrio sp.]MCR5176527.1 hypothetical protein [Anaerovibrio sp.]